MKILRAKLTILSNYTSGGGEVVILQKLYV